ncbi:MAG: succinylglutamate desuccinylase/aspartoacylase family protein [Flavobacteriales bacterium]|nr:succinylglutamate desuccinylase/aspartoacylase family protein [Flavobacteriales bacterium]
MPRSKKKSDPSACKLIQVLGESIRPGEHVTLDMQVAKLYTRTQVDIPVVVHRARQDGPSVLIMAAVHGDEVAGIEVIRRILVDLKKRPLEKGTLIAIPVLNVFGFIAMQRELPDGRDLNRYFPGSANGSLGSRLANSLVKEVLPAADVVIDLHAGGAQRMNYPQLRYTEGDQRALLLARMFDPPVILKSKIIAGTLRQYMVTKDTPYLLFESGASKQFDEQTTTEGIRGITRVLEGLDMWTGARQPARGAAELETSSWVRANHSGLLEIIVANGHHVEKGTTLANINDPYGTWQHQMRAPFSGQVLCVNTSPVVNQGDALFHLGRV